MMAVNEPNHHHHFLPHLLSSRTPWLSVAVLKSPFGPVGGHFSRPTTLFHTPRCSPFQKHFRPIPMPNMVITVLLFAHLVCVGLAKEEAFDELLKGQSPPTRCWTNGNGQEARWLAQGDLVDRGKFWYKCHEGKLQPTGCMDDKGNRISLNGTFISNGYLLECTVWGNVPRLNTVGCSPDGQRGFGAGEGWEQGQLWWQCVWEGDRLQPRQSGCLHPSTKRPIGIGKQLDAGDTIVECQQSANGALRLVAVGCISADGAHHRVGQQWKEGDFLFYCKKSGGNGEKCEKTCIGCSLQGRNLFDGDRLRQNGSVLQCEVRARRHAIRAVACVSGEGIERVVDCQWQEQSDNGQRVRRQCVLRAGRAVVDTIGCVFAKDGINRLFLRPGTFTVWRERMDGPPLGVACRDAVAGGEEPELDTFPMEEAVQKTTGLQLDNEPTL